MFLCIKLQRICIYVLVHGTGMAENQNWTSVFFGLLGEINYPPLIQNHLSKHRSSLCPQMLDISA